MTEELDKPLKRRRAAGPPTESKGGAIGRLPWARMIVALVAFAGLAVVARILLSDAPLGGRSVAEIEVTRLSKPVPNSVADATKAAVEAPHSHPHPQGPEVTIVGDDVPDGPSGAASGDLADLSGRLFEDTEFGAIPRVAPTGETPFSTFRRAALSREAAGDKKLVAIVVTGLGLNEVSTSLAVETLPSQVTLAFAPYGKSLVRQVAAARDAGHEVLLQVPLEPFDYPQSDPGPDTLITGQAPRDNLKRLFTIMGRFSGYLGVINHMGARFTASTSDFAPVMEELGMRGLAYLDDGSSSRSVAQQLAAANKVIFGRADLVLDDEPSRAIILKQLEALKMRAQDTGSAVGVASALPISIQTVAEWAESLEGQGVTLVPVSALMAAATPKRGPLI